MTLISWETDKAPGMCESGKCDHQSNLYVLRSQYSHEKKIHLQMFSFPLILNEIEFRGQKETKSITSLNQADAIGDLHYFSSSWSFFVIFFFFTWYCKDSSLNSRTLLVYIWVKSAPAVWHWLHISSTLKDSLALLKWGTLECSMLRDACVDVIQWDVVISWRGGFFSFFMWRNCYILGSE